MSVLLPTLPSLPRASTNKSQSKVVKRVWATFSDRRKLKSLQTKAASPIDNKYAKIGVSAAIDELMRDVDESERKYDRSLTNQAATAYEIAVILRTVPDEMRLFCRRKFWNDRPANARPSVKRPDEALHWLVGLLFGRSGSQRASEKVYRIRKALKRPFAMHVPVGEIKAYIADNGGSIGKAATNERKVARDEAAKSAAQNSDYVARQFGEERPPTKVRRTSLVTTGLSDELVEALKELVGSLVALSAKKQTRGRATR